MKAKRRFAFSQPAIMASAMKDSYDTGEESGAGAYAALQSGSEASVDS